MGRLAPGRQLGQIRRGDQQRHRDRGAQKRFDFATYRQDVLGFYVKSTSKINEIKQAADIAGLKIIVGSGTNQEKVLLAWNEANEKAGLKPALLQYFDDQAAAQLAVQSGRSDALFGPNSVYAYSAAITGGIKRVGTVNGGWPLQADIAVTTRKDNGLVKPIHTALQGAIAGGNMRRCCNVGAWMWNGSTSR